MLMCFQFRSSTHFAGRPSQQRCGDRYRISFPSRIPYGFLTFPFIAELAARYKEDGMLAYVELIQRKEKEIGCDVLTHQKWSVFFSS